ncbi:MAG: helix-turn-helix domain-containing protein [Oscillibacter sp.]
MRARLKIEKQHFGCYRSIYNHFLNRGDTG